MRPDVGLDGEKGPVGTSEKSSGRVGRTGRDSDEREQRKIVREEC